MPKMEGAVDAARSEHARVSELNTTDLVVMRSQMSSDLTAMLKEFVLIQVGWQGNREAGVLTIGHPVIRPEVVFVIHDASLSPGHDVSLSPGPM